MSKLYLENFLRFPVSIGKIYLFISLIFLPIPSFSQIQEVLNEKQIEKFKVNPQTILKDYNFGSNSKDTLVLKYSLGCFLNNGLRTADSLHKVVILPHNHVLQVREGIVFEFQLAQHSLLKKNQLFDSNKFRLNDQINQSTTLSLNENINKFNTVLFPSAISVPNILPKFIPNPIPIIQNVEQVTEGAKDFFEHHKGELNHARQQLSRYTNRLDSIGDLREVKGRFLFLNPLKNRPWRERVKLDMLVRYSNQEQFHLDIGPNLAWNLTDIFSLGTGFQYRISFNEKDKIWLNTDDKVMGHFSYLDSKIMNGFFGRIQFENLYNVVPRSTPLNNLESSQNKWVKGFSLGLGKTYTFYKSVSGYALAQYNLLHQHNKTPYLHPFQASIGFFVMANQLAVNLKAK
ncbi:hypothetical protein [Pontibacter fetidus]|uniref:Uncharacterized protein n=1 Tax=Pontibacter fetidus TaxID=2700082 RepID=A0A6B2HAJ2_9BACT|nr:hypothetical protein [Pontibacter fetidus]NDK57350.1 hypothetical protein [Pontibacter fetidus]